MLKKAISLEVSIDGRKNIKQKEKKPTSEFHENNAATLTNLIRHIWDQTQCREETLEEQKEKGMYGNWLQQAPTKSINKTYFSKQRKYKCCFCNHHNYNIGDCRQIKPYEKKAKLTAVRRCFRCTGEITMHVFAKQASLVKPTRKRMPRWYAKHKGESKKWTMITAKKK